MKPSKHKSVRSTVGIALSVAAAGLFLGAAHAPAAEKSEAKVHCEGANACKGKSACMSAKNSCKGKNACKGQGWSSLTPEQCVAQGGTVKKE
jgi:hypothetical protein